MGIENIAGAQYSLSINRLSMWQALRAIFVRKTAHCSSEWERGYVGGPITPGGYFRKCLLRAVAEYFPKRGLSSPRNGLREEIGHLTDTGWDEAAFRPDQVYVSNFAYKFLQDRNDIMMLEFINKGNLGEHANSNTGQNSGPNRFDTVG